MTAFTGFYDYLMPDIPNLGAAVALQAIRESCIEFCERSLVYTYDHPAIDVVAATHTYTITPESGTRTVDLLSVRHNNKALVPATEDELDATYLDWRSTGTGIPDYYLSTIDRASVRLVKTPADGFTGGLVVKIAQAPLSSATTVPDWIFERYRQAIVHGAKYRLFAMKKKPWTDDKLAMFHLHEFEQHCGSANISKAKQHTRKRLRVRTNFR